MIADTTVFINDLFDRSFSSRAADHIEGWHRVFYKAAHKAPLNMFGMMTQLKKEEQRLRAQRVLLTMGLPPQSTREKYRGLSERLPRLIDQLESDEINLLEYVKRVACNLPPVIILT